MEVSQEKNPAKAREETVDPSELTAKALAAAEEQNSLRLKKLKDREQALAAEADEEPVSIIGLAAQGREVLLEELRAHAAKTKPAEYIPPPRTPRQMQALQEELEAGRQSQAKAQAQFDSRPVPKKDVSEGFTVPVYRPNDMVPDPMTGGLGPIKSE